MNTFYLTTPLYYPNARPHVGSAYTTIVCDVIARYQRMCGKDVAFLTGTDEHGEKLERAAAAAGKSPGGFVAEKRELFKALWQKLGINYDYFIYTDQPDHVTSVQRMLRLAQKNEPGVIEKRRYEGRYCVFDERYISDGAEPVDCDVCGRPSELVTEENYFFRLSAFQDRLVELYEKHPEFVRPDYRMNEVKSFVKSGLRDISVSRKRIKWGIPWPDDPEQVFYVWYDALTGYLTGIGYAEGENGNETFQKYWRNDQQGEVVHMIGKDILRFHAVYWPAFLLAARLPLPKTVFAHGWIYYEQDKMSKSKGNVVYPEPIVDALDSFGAPGNDALRYYLLREATFGQDMSFSYDALIQRYNSDLANDLGNLASRTLNMLHQNFGGILPATPEPLGAGSLPQHQFRMLGNSTIQQWLRCFDNYDFSGGLDAAWQMISVTNRYLGYTQPWTLAGDISNRDRLASILRTSAEALRLAAIFLHPVLPVAAQKLWEQLGRTDEIGKVQTWRLAWDVPGDPTSLRPGIKVGKPEAIFPAIKNERREALLAKLHELAEADYDRDKPKEGLKTVETESAKSPEPSSSTGVPPVQEDTAKIPVLPNPNASTPTPDAQHPTPAVPQITIEDFAKVEMRVGEIISTEPIPKATKLLKIQVDIGTEIRQVLAGIAEHYQPEQLVGMKVVVVTNLQPRKMRGLESNGMIVAASVGEGGRPVLVTFKEDVPKGARLK